jgi:hypothetical protein
VERHQDTSSSTKCREASSNVPAVVTGSQQGGLLHLHVSTTSGQKLLVDVASVLANAAIVVRVITA